MKQPMAWQVKEEEGGGVRQLKVRQKRGEVNTRKTIVGIAERRKHDTTKEKLEEVETQGSEMETLQWLLSAA